MMLRQTADAPEYPRIFEPKADGAGEGYLLLEKGASVPQIDHVLTSFGMPVGPFGMQDIAGIDLGARFRGSVRGGEKGSEYSTFIHI